MSGLAPGFLSVATRGAAKKQRAVARIPGEGASDAVSAEEFAELRRQFEALSGRYEGLVGALAAEKLAREDVEQRLAQAEAKAVTLAEDITELRNSQQRFDISTRRASLVVHNVPESPGVDAGDALQQVCTSAGLQPLTYSEAVRLGKPPAEAGAGGEVRPRPVLVKFGAVQQKHELLQQSKVLRGQKVYLDDDLTPFQRSMRAKLSSVFKLLKFYKRPRFWRQERLFTVFEGALVPCDLRTVPPGCCRAAAAA